MSAGKSNYVIDCCLVTAAALMEESFLHRGEGSGFIPPVRSSASADLSDRFENSEWLKLHLVTGIIEEH